jgi:hypothetical protein
LGRQSVFVAHPSTASSTHALSAESDHRPFITRWLFFALCKLTNLPCASAPTLPLLHSSLIAWSRWCAERPHGRQSKEKVRSLSRDILEGLEGLEGHSSFSPLCLSPFVPPAQKKVCTVQDPQCVYAFDQFNPHSMIYTSTILIS